MKIFCLLFILIPTSVFAYDQEHKLWSKVLKNNTSYEKGQVYVDYKKLKKHPEQLLAYLDQLKQVSEKEFASFSRKEKLSFWINAYNAFTIQWILRHYPIDSIKDTGSLFSSAWSKEFINILGHKRSLDDIEHEIIRKNFREPRIHFAVNCASISCPNLRREAFIANEIDKQLQDSAHKFLNNPTKNFLDKKDKTLYLSKIFKWYGADFNAQYKGYIKFIKKHLKLPKEFAVEWLDYDWSLNGSSSNNSKE